LSPDARPGAASGDRFYHLLQRPDHGAAEQQVVHVRPGFWVLACFFDTQDHREHTTLGMERVIHITN